MPHTGIHTAISLEPEAAVAKVDESQTATLVLVIVPARELLRHRDVRVCDCRNAIPQILRPVFARAPQPFRHSSVDVHVRLRYQATRVSWQTCGAASGPNILHPRKPSGPMRMPSLLRKSCNVRAVTTCFTDQKAIKLFPAYSVDENTLNAARPVPLALECRGLFPPHTVFPILYSTETTQHEKKRRLD